MPEPRKRTSSYPLGDFLKMRRLENGWTQDEAAKKMELSFTQLKSIENDEPKSVHTICKAFDFYGFNLEPTRKGFTSKGKREQIIKKLMDLAVFEFAEDKKPTKSHQLLVAGRVIELMKQLAIVDQERVPN